MRHRLISLLLLAFVAPHVWVIAAGQEFYPLTCAAMFAHPVDDQTPRYTLRLSARFAGDDDEHRVEFYQAGANPRHFFSHTLGSASPASHHRHYTNDTPEQYAQRLEAWLQGYAASWDAWHPDEPPMREVTVWLQPVHPIVQPPRALARYDVRSERLTLHPQAAWPQEPAP